MRGTRSQMAKNKKSQEKKESADQLPKVVKIKRSKFKCATTGKHECDECQTPIERGQTIRMVSVKYADGLTDQMSFCSKECRNAYCDRHNFPLK